jgi:hypothetical protein
MIKLNKKILIEKKIKKKLLKDEKKLIQNKTKKKQNKIVF